MSARTNQNWETVRPGIQRRIAEGDSVQTLAWRYQVTVGTMERVLKQLGLETFDQRFQRLTAKSKGKGG